MAKVLGDVWAGTTHMLHGNIEHATRQLFATTADREFLITPMTYMMKGRQYVAIAAGGNVLSFALPQNVHSEPRP